MSQCSICKKLILEPKTTYGINQSLVCRCEPLYPEIGAHLETIKSPKTTYSRGNMTESQFVVLMEEAVYNFIELQAVAGKPFTVEAYVQHLKDSY